VINSTVIGIDLAKTVLQVGVMSNSKLTSNKQVRRASLHSLMANHPPSVVAMEACYSSNYWAREFEAMGHTIKLIPAQHVKPFTRGNKTDANDALAIIEASYRPNLRFVPITTTHQQDIQCMHRIRERRVSNRTGLTNQARGLLAEYGIVSKKGKKGFLLAVQLGLNDDNLSELVKTELHFALDELQQASDHITKIEATLRAYVENNENCRISHSTPGIGVINTPAIECKYGNGPQFSK
jgi:transposase